MKLNLKNGTIFFVDTGERLIGITAYHVYQQYLKDSSNNTVIAQIYRDFEFNPEKRLIDGDEKLDVAIFDISKHELEKIGKRPLKCNQNIWPPVLPKKSQGVLVVGFPGKERIIVDKENFIIEWGYILLLLSIKELTNDKISLQIERDYCDETSDMPYKYDMGGISGAPLLVLETSNIISWQLGGIVYEANKEYELIFARPINFINDDGHLIKNF